MKRERSKGSATPRVVTQVCLALLFSTGLSLLPMSPAAAATLDRVRETGKLMLGFRVDARPFSYQDASGKAIGYSVALCEKIAAEVKAELGLPDLALEWVPVTLDARFQAVAQGRVDLICAADTATLGRRKEVAFSLPIFPSGIAAVLRADAPAPLRDVLAGRPATGPIWRASPARILEDKTFSVVTGTTSETWLSGRLKDFQLSANVDRVANYNDGVMRVIDRSSDVLFGDRPILLEAAAENAAAADLTVLDKLFTYEPVALTLGRNDDDFRLVVDRALSQAFKANDFPDVYSKWFGTPDQAVLAFFRQSAMPE
jgi:polar amino acid transport system substrate-binding protein